MEPIKDITQNEIIEIIDNPVDQASNKIKLRSVSQENLVRHLKSVPYKAKPEPQVESSKINLPQEAKKWSLTPKQYVNYMEGPRKPINVKETMIENMRRHSEVVSQEVEMEVPKMSVEEKEVPITVSTMVEETSEAVNVSEVTMPVQEEQVKEANTVEAVKEENQDSESTNDLDVEKKYEEINNIRQQVLSKKEEADQAQREAEESEKVVQELGVQYTEVQKQLQEAKLKNKEVKRKVLVALSSQSSTLANAKKQYETLIEDAKKRKEQNQNKIAEINPKIKTVEDETMSLNNDTARAEEFLNAIYSNDIAQFPYVNDVEEEKVKRIA